MGNNMFNKAGVTQYGVLVGWQWRCLEHRLVACCSCYPSGRSTKSVVRVKTAGERRGRS
jgi:hypothetical protein